MAETIRVGPVTYTLIRDPALGADGALGTVNTNRQEIRLAAGMASERERIELWHEVIHAILFGAGIDEHDEQVVGALAHGIVAALKDNSGSVLYEHAEDAVGEPREWKHCFCWD